MDRNIELGPYITTLGYIDVDVRGEEEIDFTAVKGSELSILKDIGLLDQEISYSGAEINIHWRANLKQGPNGIDRIIPEIQKVEGTITFDVMESGEWDTLNSVVYPILILPGGDWKLDLDLSTGDMKFKPGSVVFNFRTLKAEIVFD